MQLLSIEYDKFLVFPQKDDFKLELGRKLFGSLCDALSYQNNMKFSTWDNDNDYNSKDNFAHYFEGSFW